MIQGSVVSGYAEKYRVTYVVKLVLIDYIGYLDHRMLTIL